MSVRREGREGVLQLNRRAPSLRRIEGIVPTVDQEVGNQAADVDLTVLGIDTIDGLLDLLQPDGSVVESQAPPAQAEVLASVGPEAQAPLFEALSVLVELEKGIGLKSIDFRTNYMGGNYEVDSKVGEGTLISINVPLVSSEI